MHQITRSELLELIQQHTYYHIARKILHIGDNSFNKLLAFHGIEKEPMYKRKRYPEVSQFQKEFILGSLLGDVAVVKKGPQHRLSFTHNTVQLAYMEHKQKVLGDLGLSRIQHTTSKAHEISIFISGEYQKHVVKETNGLIYHSIVHPYFTELRSRLYPNNKKTISDWWLQQVTPISLAYWIMDDGFADFSDNSYVIRISTYCYSYDEHLLLQEFLNDCFGIELQLQKVARGSGWICRLRTDDSKRLRDIIAPYIIDSMRYKIDRSAWLAA